jgi:hypothetical protein
MAKKKLNARKRRKPSPAGSGRRVAAKKGARARHTPQEEPPQAALMQVMFGMMASKCVSAVTAIGVPDALKDGPASSAALAEQLGADPDALRRAMRLLAGLGLFTEKKPGVYGLTPASELLRADVPGSMQAMTVMITSQSHWQPWGRLEDVLRTGESGARHAFGTDVFSWFQRPENKGQWEIFNDAMTSFSSSTAHAVAASVPFGRFRNIIDVGGGHGYLLKTILAAAPKAKGTVYDLAGVVGTARPVDRVRFEAGDFFKAVPAGGDCYVLKHIIHDWSDAQSAVILSNIARVMEPGGRVFVIETVMPDAPGPHPAKFMDVNMLAMTEGGRERTAEEYRKLFKTAGLALVKIHATPSPASVIEAKARR